VGRASELIYEPAAATAPALLVLCWRALVDLDPLCVLRFAITGYCAVTSTMNAQQKHACTQREDETSVNEFLAEELTRVTKSKNKSELELARVKNRIRKHDQNLRKMKQRIREMIQKMREEEAFLETAKTERDQISQQLTEDMDINII